MGTYQKNILKVFAMRSAKHTWREKPSGSCVRKICRYCGTYGRTPPHIIAPAARCPRTFPKWLLTNLDFFSYLMNNALSKIIFMSIFFFFFLIGVLTSSFYNSICLVPKCIRFDKESFKWSIKQGEIHEWRKMKIIRKSKNFYKYIDDKYFNFA